MPEAHRLTLRVYYEDTDLAGIVYHANYLKFIERARSEWVRALGIDQAAMKAETGAVFAVARIEADFLSPARYDDLLEVRTLPVEASGARAVLVQEVWRDQTRLFAARVTLAVIGASGRPARMPQALRAAVGG